MTERELETALCEALQNCGVEIEYTADKERISIQELARELGRYLR